MKRLYLSTTIPYVNADPHLGFALEAVQADVLARAARAEGREVFFTSGTDDNALKNVLAAEAAGLPTEEFVTQHSARFRELREVLNLSLDDFISTREKRHIKGAQKFWATCRREDIYLKKYKGLYCVGCEEFKTEKELESGKCPEHPNLKPETVEEENYFFRLSSYQKKLEELIASDTFRIAPETRKHEVLNFIRQGLQDFSISRSRERARGWGIPVPVDERQVMYVWFDALTNYLNVLGYADDAKRFHEFWKEGERMHVLGKGVLRFHAVYWPAMLISAGLPLPTRLFVHGYLTKDGQKMSKSTGNVISPQEAVAQFGTDAIRYYLLREIPAYEDGDWSEAKCKERYNADLANGIGNFAARTLTLAEKCGTIEIDYENAQNKELAERIEDVRTRVNEKLSIYKFHEALAALFELVSWGDAYINAAKPWEKMDKIVIGNLLVALDAFAVLLSPFLPETAEKIQKKIHWKDSGKKEVAAEKGDVLFPRMK